MSTTSFRLASYFQYIRQRRTVQYIHSPFLFGLMQEVFDDSSKLRPDWVSDIERLRKVLTHNNQSIEFNDLGAGGDGQPTRQVLVSDLARKSVKQAKYARFLHRLAVHGQAKTIVELGTSLGLTTAYLSKSESRTVTVEGDPTILQLAQNNWNELGIKSIESHCFDLNNGLVDLYQQLNKIDFLFIDANHRCEAMIRYYLQALPFLHEKSVVVFDDIYWNEETLEAWKTIKSRKEITLSFDIFQMGVVFFDKNLSKEDFTLKY